MSRVQMRAVPVPEDPLAGVNPLAVGEWYLWRAPNGIRYFVFGTPKGATLHIPINEHKASWHFDGNLGAPTLTPSVWHDKGGKWDWHGHVTAGYLVNA